jgi:hypothetical protein
MWLFWESAKRLLRVHDLRTADALQLAAAVFVAEARPPTLEFVSLDDRLLAAARREGFPTTKLAPCRHSQKRDRLPLDRASCLMVHADDLERVCTPAVVDAIRRDGPRVDLSTVAKAYFATLNTA